MIRLAAAPHYRTHPQVRIPLNQLLLPQTRRTTEVTWNIVSTSRSIGVQHDVEYSSVWVYISHSIYCNWKPTTILNTTTLTTLQVAISLYYSCKKFQRCDSLRLSSLAQHSRSSCSTLVHMLCPPSCQVWTVRNTFKLIGVVAMTMMGVLGIVAGTDTNSTFARLSMLQTRFHVTST